VMTLTGVALLAFSLSRHREPKLVEPVVASSAPEPSPAPPSEVASTIELPATTPGKKTRAVTFTANWNVKVVRFGDRSVNVVPPRQVVALTVPEEDFEVEALSTDGRKASATLDKQTNALTIVFPPRMKPPEDLAPSPYKKNP